MTEKTLDSQTKLELLKIALELASKSFDSQKFKPRAEGNLQVKTYFTDIFEDCCEVVKAQYSAM